MIFFPSAAASRAFLFSAFFLLAAVSGRAQESGTPATPVPQAVAGPSAALRDVLSAACSQNAEEFSRFLSVRNAESFSRLTPVARVALMKRFVLLDEPGKATSSVNPVGRPIVRCETPAVTTEMQIGGADIEDNLAFLPLRISDVTDSAGANIHQITMGLVRENGRWKLLSLGLLLLDLPSLEVEWDAAEIDTNEQAAIDSLKQLADAVESYRRTYTHLPESLASLGPPLHGPPVADAAGLIDSDLAAGRKNGYSFRYVIVGASDVGAPAKYEVAATPIIYGRTGRRSFFRDQAGGLHGADRRGAIGGSSDPPVK